MYHVTGILWISQVFDQNLISVASLEVKVFIISILCNKLTEKKENFQARSSYEFNSQKFKPGSTIKIVNNISNKLKLTNSNFKLPILLE